MMRRRALFFIAAGGTGFAVNGLVLTALLPWAGPWIGQGVAYLTSLVATWWINSRITFADRTIKGVKSKSRYVAASLAATAIVNGIYALLVLRGVHPFVSLVAGAITGAFASYGLMNRWVFGEKLCQQ